MIMLPPGAIVVRRDIAEVKSLIFGVEPEVLYSGIILYSTGDEVAQFEGCRVYFRENFYENMMIKGEKLLYFRDWKSGIYYIDSDDKG